MKLLICFFLFTQIFSLTFATTKIPRQLISLSGLIQKSAPKSFSVNELSKISLQKEMDIFDPYNKDIKTHFYTVPLSFFIKNFPLPTATHIRMTAIDGYKVDIKLLDLQKLGLFIAYKDNQGFLTVDRMGPARIIENIPNKIDKDTIAKIGVNWIWQIKNFEFITK